MERVVVCPYCDCSSPQPEQLGLTYLCTCGAVFALFPEHDLGIGLADLVGDLFEESSQPLGQLLDQCQVTVYQGYEDPAGAAARSALAEFIKEARFGPGTETGVNLVWVARENTNQDVDGFGQIQN
jgi:hypothetical protein